MEWKRCSQQELEAGMGSFDSWGRLATQVTLNHRIAQGWFLHSTNKDSNLNLSARGSNEPFLYLKRRLGDGVELPKQMDHYKRTLRDSLTCPLRPHSTVTWKRNLVF